MSCSFHPQPLVCNVFTHTVSKLRSFRSISASKIKYAGDLHGSYSNKNYIVKNLALSYSSLPLSLPRGAGTLELGDRTQETTYWQLCMTINNAPSIFYDFVFSSGVIWAPLESSFTVEAVNRTLYESLISNRQVTILQENEILRFYVNGSYLFKVLYNLEELEERFN